MENNNTNVNQIPGWRNAQITGDLPLNAIVHFLNILNERLCVVEDNMILTVDENGSTASLTQIYAEQAKEEMEAEENNDESVE